MLAGILLAAGESKRMEGAFKPLLKWGTRTVIGECVEQLNKSKLDEIFVVLGHRELEIRQRLTGTGVQYAINENYQQGGMLSSVKIGWAQIAPSTDGVLIALVDQPMVKTSVINKLIDAFQHTDKRIVVPTYDGKQGHPIILNADFEDDLMQLADDTPNGLRALIEANRDEILEVEVDSPAILEDIDQPGDYERLSKAVEPHYAFRKWNP
jgi:molybdenum cofactor cytidylyltransferase